MTSIHVSLHKGFYTSNKSVITLRSLTGLKKIYEMYFVCIAVHVCVGDMCEHVQKSEDKHRCHFLGLNHSTLIKPGPLGGPELTT